MRPQQQRAWFIVCVCLLAIAAVLFLLLGGAGQAASGGLGLVALVILAPLLFRKRRGRAEPTEDERDTAIEQQAERAGACSSHVTFIVLCLGPYFVYWYQGKESIRTDYLGFAAVVGTLVLLGVSSITTLVLYGRAPACDRK